jgi:RNA ligase (TIGR02306 family)
MTDNIRKLVTVRRVDAIDPIEGADAIEVATIEGWKVVTKKGEFKVGDDAVYFEIDSFLPTGNPAWQFLVDKSSRSFNGVAGHRLRTVKLRGQVSQGLVLPLRALPAVTDFFDNTRFDGASARDFDLSDILGIVKWEQELPAELAGRAAGVFPSYIPKTDQERAQNLRDDIFQVEDRLFPFDVSLLDAQVIEALMDKGQLVSLGDGSYAKVMKAKASLDDEFEVTIKLDGSSATFFHKDGHIAACSRNLELKTDESNKDNAFVRMLHDSGFITDLPKLGNIAIQGELMGPGIQGNREKLTKTRLFVFDIYLIDEARYATPVERKELFEKLMSFSNGNGLVEHAPVLAYSAKLIDTLGIKDVEGLLKFAEGKSINNEVREGVVFKRLDGKFSFKAISNKFLLKESD